LGLLLCARDLAIDVPEDFLAKREDSPPHLRELMWFSPTEDTPAR
jgi:hypothetical protein